MAIVLCRHGQTALNKALVVQPADTPLDAHGIAQAERLAARVAAMPVARIVTSDLARARMTAAPIERASGLGAEPTPLLQERNFGDLRGKSYAELGIDIYAADYVPPNGESWEVFHARIAEAWAWCVERARGLRGDLVVVTHGLFCRTLVARHLELAPGVTLPGHWGNASVTIADVEPPHLVRTLGCTEHLARLDVASTVGQV